MIFYLIIMANPLLQIPISLNLCPQRVAQSAEDHVS
jgi:hypothetical protein